MWGSVLHAEKHAGEIDRDDLIPGLLGIIRDRDKNVAFDAGIVERIIQLAEALDGARNQRRNLRRLPHVGLNEQRRAPGGLDQANRLPGLIGPAAGDHHLGALLGEGERGGATDARAAARDERNVAIELHVH
jgi:hypothetical protein